MEFRKQFQGFLLRIWAPRLEREGGNLLNISWMNERISFYPCCPLILSECAAPIPNRSLLFPECPCLPYFLCASCPSLALQFICSHTPFSQLAYSAWMPHNSSSFLLSSFNWNIALIPLQSNSAYPVSSCPSTLNLLGMSVLSSPYMSLYYASCFHSQDVSKWQKEPWVLFLSLPQSACGSTPRVFSQYYKLLGRLPLLTWEDERCNWETESPKWSWRK